MKAPPLEDVVRDLEELAGTEVDASLTIKDLEIDSLVLAEWAFSLQERFDVFVAEDRLQGIAEMSIADVYDMMLREAGLQPS